MTDDSTNAQAQPTSMQMPPIPLVSGDTFTAADGTSHTATSVKMTITGEDGTTLEIMLDNRFGGWWAPKPGPVS